MKFKVVAGYHCEGERHPVTGKLISYGPGEIIESQIDLVKLHGREKFEPVSSDVPVTRRSTTTAPQQTNPPSQKESGHTAKELEGMTLEELKRLAAEEEIDLGNLSKKNEIIARIVSVGSPVTA